MCKSSGLTQKLEMKYLLWGVGILGTYYAFTKITASKKINVVFKKFGIGKASGFSLPPILAVFTLQNPTSTQVTINSIVGDIYVNGEDVANVTEFNKLIIKGNSQNDLTVNVHVGVLSAAKLLLNYFNTGRKINANFQGTVNAEGFAIPVNESLGL